MVQTAESVDKGCGQTKNGPMNAIYNSYNIPGARDTLPNMTDIDPLEITVKTDKIRHEFHCSLLQLQSKGTNVGKSTMPTIHFWEEYIL